MTLSRFLRDYLYIPMGGSRGSKAQTYRNLMLTMLIGGLWHGAAWNFVLWGAWHGLGLIFHRAFAMRTKKGSRIRIAAGWLLTMLFVFYGWLLFRAQSFDQIVNMTRSFSNWSTPVWIGSYLTNLAVFVIPLLVVEVWQFRSRNLLVALSLSRWALAALQGLLLLAVVLYWERVEVPFIYFQF